MSYKTILIISAIVVFVLGITTYIVIQIWVRRYRAKYVRKAQEEAFIKVQSMRNDIGQLPFVLKDEFRSKSNDLDIEGLINTVYLNHYQSLLILSKRDLFAFAAVVEKVKTTGYYLIDEFDFEKYNQVRRKMPEEFQQAILPYDDQPLDFVCVFSSNLDIMSIYQKYYQKLNENGMIAICLKFFKNREAYDLVQLLKKNKIQHEVSYISNKFLFIVKKNIKLENKNEE
ncbi:hypothetical protein BCF59_0572 [Mycoplasmopsis mustelae]|uniref:Uncharacterized protein n=1 Tax=Mycoplasmopsis mustelae TaxID=171289 RepID=A0A4R7UDR2_9BACT|nr:hypothetical protein [Mycoplasmopsis mustelae]TDV23580.1 hypothetical protein BCF59_0572 [Mycoplasmopsis mustelae]